MLASLSLVGLLAGCASTAGQPWNDVRVGMTDNEAAALGGHVCSVNRDDDGAIVQHYTGGGFIACARDAEGVFRVVRWERP